MKTTGLLCLVVACICAVTSVTAQENVALHFEMYKNGKQFGAPSVTVKDSETGSLELGNIGNAKVSFTASRVDARKVAVAFTVVTAGKTLKPRVVLLNQESGWVSWKSGSDSFDVRVIALPRWLAPQR